MRRSFKRAGLLAVAILLAFAGAISVAGPAAAVKLQNQLRISAVTQACSASTCARDAITIPAGTSVDTYCVIGNLNVTYTGPSTGRGGFVNVAAFTMPGSQFSPCDDSGFFAQVKDDADTTLGSCTGPCVNFGTVKASGLLRAFCELSETPNRWFLVFVEAAFTEDGTPRAGFIRESALSKPPGVPSCNSPF
jgi:hypothetical protein